MMPDVNYKVIGVIAILAVALGVGTFSFSDIESERDMQFIAGEAGDHYNHEYSDAQGINVYGQQVYLEHKKVNPDEVENYAVFHVGGDSNKLSVGEEEAKLGNWRLEVKDSSKCEYIQNLDTICGDYYRFHRYSLSLDVPKDEVTADFKNVRVEDVGQGEKKVEADIVVENNFNPIRTEELSAEVFGNTIDLDSGVIPEGKTEYDIVTSKDYYDSSKFLVNEEINTELKLNFRNPSVPDDMVSGYVEMDGDWTTFETFNSDYHVEERVYDLELKDFSSVSEDISTRVQYCGENATFSDGECVIDDELHLRGDLCPLLGDQQIVTRTLNEGVYDSNDLSPEPSFFCTKHPVLVTESEGDQTDFTTKPYRKMVDGETFTVPEGQTYTLYWTINIEENNISTVCEQGSFNPETGNCEVTQGVVHQCSTGVWNPDTGSCVVHPEVEPVCQNGRYNTETGTCVFEAESAAQCGTGSFENGMCYQQANVKQVCADDANMTDGVCQSEAAVLVQNSVLDSFRLLVDNIIHKGSEALDSLVSTVTFWN